MLRHKLHLQKLEEEKKLQLEDFQWRVQAEAEIEAAEKSA